MITRRRHIPGWHRKVACDWTEQTSPFSDLFRDNYLTRSYEDPFGARFNVVHHNLYDPLSTVKKLNDEVHLFILSAHLKSVDDIELIKKYRTSIDEAELSFGFFSVPHGTNISSHLHNSPYIQKLNDIECGIVLMDAQAIADDSPKLPLYNPYDTSQDRILQTAVLSVVEPVISMNMIACDFCDLKALSHHGKIYGLGIGFIDLEKDLGSEVKKSFSSICSQMNLGEHEGHLVSSCWSNVSGNHQFSMDHYQATAMAITNYCNEDSFYISTVTFDQGLEEHLMLTCLLGIGVDT